jgi:hypothetical protein
VVNHLCSVPILCDDHSYFQIKFGHLGMWGYNTLVFDHHCHHNLGNPGVVSSVVAIMWEGILHVLIILWSAFNEFSYIALEDFLRRKPCC